MFSTPFWKKRKCHFIGSGAHHPAAKCIQALVEGPDKKTLSKT
jgi:hypothetical protein